MTDSVKLWALSERLVARIGALQLQVAARAGEAARRLLQTALPPAADLASPSSLGEEVEHVGTAEQTDHLAALDDRDPSYALSDQEASGLIDSGLLTDRDHAPAD